jgi:hypothetical protein
VVVVRIPPVGRRRLPFAVGILRPPVRSQAHHADPADHGAEGVDVDALLAGSAARVSVAMVAGEAGFCLLDVVEVGAEGGANPQDWARLWGLAVRTDPEAVFVLGLSLDERAVLELMAAELRLVVREVVIPGGSTGDDADSTSEGTDGPQGQGSASGVLAAGRVWDTGSSGVWGWPAEGGGSNGSYRADRKENR